MTVRDPIAKIALILVFLPLILPLILFALVLFALHRLSLYLLVWLLWLAKGEGHFVCVFQ
jgi:hypothetical protein